MSIYFLQPFHHLDLISDWYFLMHSLFVRFQIAPWFGIIAAFVTLQRFLFFVFAELVVSKMLFSFKCFVTQWARNIFFNVDIPVILSECFLGLELFATHITNKITNHYCEFWFLQLLWSYSDECLSQTDSKAVSWNFHFSDDRSNTLNARPLIEISGWVFFFGISKVWKGRELLKIWVPK